VAVVKALARMALLALAEAVAEAEVSVQAAQALALLIRGMLAAQISILALTVVEAEAVVRMVLVQMEQVPVHKTAATVALDLQMTQRLELQQGAVVAVVVVPRTEQAVQAQTVQVLAQAAVLQDKRFMLFPTKAAVVEAHLTTRHLQGKP